MHRRTTSTVLPSSARPSGVARDEDEPRAVRDRDVAGPRKPRLDAADEALGYGLQEPHSVLARERLAGRSTRELPAIGKLLGEDMISWRQCPN